MAGKSYCVVCGEQKGGLPVKIDYVIDAIRWFKTKVTKNEKNNALVVCKECYPKYVAMRKKYVSRMYMYVGLGILFTVLVIALNPSIGSFLIGMLLTVALFLFSFLNYMPGLDIDGRKRQK
ncbi:MAG: hypothetical protein KGI00_04375 [Candidatus Micrarchaeota archaeon]|nr:hypothetical protein [Candidatus Micrarchaeota archaeon]MDE1849935.1 hypothetical protein [Candidatus Micrarchaeota archaeon]